MKTILITSLLLLIGFTAGCLDSVDIYGHEFNDHKKCYYEDENIFVGTYYYTVGGGNAEDGCFISKNRRVIIRRPHSDEQFYGDLLEDGFKECQNVGNQYGFFDICPLNTPNP